MIFRRRIVRIIRGSLRFVLIASTFLFLHFYFFISSIQHTYILNAAVLVNTVLIITLILSWVLGVSRPKKLDLSAIFLGFLGILILAAPRLKAGWISVGNLEALMVALMISLYAVYAKKISLLYKLYVLSSIIYLLAGVEALIASSTTIELGSATQHDLLFLLLLAFIPTAFGHTMYLASIENTDLHRTQLLALLELVSASILASILFGETPSIMMIVGAILILIGTTMITLREFLVKNNAGVGSNL